VRIMSDLSPNDNPHRQRRNARRRAGVGPSAQKKSAPTQASDEQDQARSISRPQSTKEVAKLNQREAQVVLATDKASAQQGEPAPESAAGQDTISWRKLTPLSKQILLWGAIAGVALVVFSLGENLLFNLLAPNQAAANANQTALQVTVCVGYIVPIALLAFGGMRATARMGLPRHGGMAGVWASVVALLIGLIVGFIILAASGPQSGGSSQSSLGQNIVNTLTDALFNIAIGFGAGWIGGRYSEWKRKKAQRQQEVAVAP
jgi:hypothetical protein